MRRLAGGPGRRRGALAALVAVVTLLFQLPFYDRWASFMDEGHMLQFAHVVANGGELYRDAPVYPLPGAFYLLAAAFRLSGESILVARRIVAVEFAVLASVVFLLLRRLVPPAGAAAGVLLLFVYRIWAFPHWQMYSYSSTALCLLALGLLGLVRFLETGGRAALVLAGVAIGLGVLTKQDYGAAVLLAANVVLLIALATEPAPRRRPLAAFLSLDGPPLVLGALTVLHFWRAGLLVEMLRLTAWEHLVGIATFDYPSLPRIFPLLQQDAKLRDSYAHVVYAPPILFTVDWQGLRASWVYTRTALFDVGLKIFFYLPYAVLLVEAVRLWCVRAGLRDPTRRPRALAEVSLAAFAAALVLSLNKPRDYVHVAVLYWPILVLLVVQAHALVRGRRARVLALAAGALVLGVPALAYTARLAWRIRTEHSAPLALPRAQIAVRPVEAQLLEDTIAWIHGRAGPDDPVAVLPYFPLISFLAERAAPHPSSYVVWPVKDRPDRDEQIVQALERTRTPAVVYSLTQWAAFPPFERYAPRIFEYLVEDYEIERVFSVDPWGYLLTGLRRRDHAPAGTPLPLEDGTLRVETPGLPARPVASGERSSFVARTAWPFERVVALRPLSGGRRTVLAVDVDVPPGARLATAVAVHPGHWVGYPPSAVTFTLAVDGAVRFTRTLDPQREVADRHWVPVDVPLAAVAGRRVRLEFGVACERPEAETLEMAGWAIPRLIAHGERDVEGAEGRGISPAGRDDG